MNAANVATGLRGKRVIVTGSSQGIGRAVAERLLQEGARVVLNGRDAEQLAATLEALTSLGEVVACAGSVADYDLAGELVALCRRCFAGVDVLINCAGIAEPQGTSILDIEPGDWRQLIDVHLHGTFNTCRQVAPVMAQQGGGTIINTSSHAFLGLYGGTGYAAGKGATNSLSYAMAADLQAHGIDVNVVCPGAKTRLSTGAEFIDKIEDLHERGLLSEERRLSALNPAPPEYVAALYAVLASDLARGVSGQVFWGSGGHMGRFLANGQEVLASMERSAQEAAAPEEPPWQLVELAAKLNLRQVHGPG